jgi:hypothetical protein
MNKEPYYDPRDPDQRPDLPATWKPTNNPALVAGRILGANFGEEEWKGIAEFADYCDEPISGIADLTASQNAPRRSSSSDH